MQLLFSMSWKVLIGFFQCSHGKGALDGVSDARVGCRFSRKCDNISVTSSVLESANPSCPTWSMKSVLCRGMYNVASHQVESVKIRVQIRRLAICDVKV